MLRKLDIFTHKKRGKLIVVTLITEEILCVLLPKMCDLSRTGMHCWHTFEPEMKKIKLKLPLLFLVVSYL